MPEAWVYVLRCRDGSLYTGWTVDLERRLARHRAGVASRYTASRLPVELELAMPMPDRTAARREEARIKRLPRAAKLTLLSAAQATRTTDRLARDHRARPGARDRARPARVVGVSAVPAQAERTDRGAA
jgi:putative endonuclease